MILTTGVVGHASRGSFFASTDRHDPDEPTVVDNRQRPVAALQHLFEYEVLHAQPGCCYCRCLIHQAADWHSAQGLALRLPMARRFVRIVQEPADKSGPHSAAEIAGEQTREAPHNQEPAYGLAGV